MGQCELSRSAINKQMLAYVACDVFESCWMEHAESMRREGVELTFKASHAAGKLKKGFDELRQIVKFEDEDVQIALGDMSDMVRALMVLVIDRCSSDEEFFKMYCDIKNRYKSKMGMDLTSTERTAFGIINNGKGK